jgi:2-polyprenyl-3-methyl-5-hydroxy-6-metoxy-1,4-benzoquinol methylase
VGLIRHALTLLSSGGVDERWGEILRRFEQGPEDHWLERWQTVLDTSRKAPILELGCGGGHDARFLTGLGFAVVATDFSEEALGLTRRRAPEARLENSPAGCLSPTPLFG